MFDDLITIEKSVKEILIDLMAEMVMSVRVQASSMSGFQDPHRLQVDLGHPEP